MYLDHEYINFKGNSKRYVLIGIVCTLKSSTLEKPCKRRTLRKELPFLPLKRLTNGVVYILSLFYYKYIVSYSFNMCHIGQVMDVACELKKWEQNNIIMEIPLWLYMQHLGFGWYCWVMRYATITSPCFFFFCMVHLTIAHASTYYTHNALRTGLWYYTLGWVFYLESLILCILCIILGFFNYNTTQWIGIAL